MLRLCNWYSLPWTVGDWVCIHTWLSPTNVYIRFKFYNHIFLEVVGDFIISILHINVMCMHMQIFIILFHDFKVEMRAWKRGKCACYVTFTSMLQIKFDGVYSDSLRRNNLLAVKDTRRAHEGGIGDK